MIGFKQYLKEYLTDVQRGRYAGAKMTDKARADTDHFFGVGNDSIREELPEKATDKSEIHQKVERHLGREISHDEYRNNKLGGRKLTGLIKDKDLLQEYNADSTRRGSRVLNRPYMTVHRGIEVAGQTNDRPTQLHPSGHSWGDQSCKNVDDGSNRHYLEKEIKHGTVVVFGHDHNGKEIYRATLHPYHNEHDQAAYAVESEYGLKHPDFTAHAHDVATRLSGEYKPGIFKKQPDVYDDSGSRSMLHPQASADDLRATYDSGVKSASLARGNRNVPADLLDKAISDDKNSTFVWKAALSHPNIQPEHISRALNSRHETLKIMALENTTAVRPEHIDKALQEKNWLVRSAAIQHPTAVQPRHIDAAMDDVMQNVTAAALAHPTAVEPRHITQILNDKSWAAESTVHTALKHPTAVTPAHITRVLAERDPYTQQVALEHPTAVRPEHIDQIIAAPDSDRHVLRTALRHPTAVQPRHIDWAFEHEDPWLVSNALRHSRAATPQHIERALKSPITEVREDAMGNPNVRPEHIDMALDDKNAMVAWQAIQHPNASSENLAKALDHKNADIRRITLKHPSITPEHLKKAMSDADEGISTFAKKLYKEKTGQSIR